MATCWLQATDMARFMVAECGMNDAVGPMFVSDADARHNVLSERVKERIDAQVCVSVRVCAHARVRMVCLNRVFVSSLLRALLLRAWPAAVLNVLAPYAMCVSVARLQLCPVGPHTLPGMAVIVG